MRGIRYRPDIDGLRALAIVPVLLYHLKVPLFSGGYAGVDVFFVISGFLITSTVRADLEGGTFSVGAFYERRARRILPALLVMLAGVLVAGWFLFLPDEFRSVGSRIVAVPLFASNFLLWHQADYFAGPIDMDPLVHTWSLAVEEQFYIFFPLFLWLCEKYLQRRYTIPTLILATASFAFSVVFLRIDRTGTYYLLPTRAWELLFGALLAYHRLPAIRSSFTAETIAAGGAVMIVASTILLTSTSDFPGVNALWPCLGTAGVIYANSHRQTATAKLLGSKPLVGIGLISYSLYLFHWPLIVFVRYQLLREPDATEKLAILATTFVLATLSWRFIERPFVRRRGFSPRAALAAVVGSAAGLVAAGLAVFVSQGVPSRYAGVHLPPFYDPTESTAGPTCFLKSKTWRDWAGSACFLTRGDAPNALLWGDSHANQYRDVIRNAKPAPIANLLLYATAGCAPVFDMYVPGQPECRENNEHVLAVVRRFGVKTIILSGNWGYALKTSRIGMKAVRKTIDRLRALGLRVFVIGDNPTFPFSNPGYLAYRLSKRPDPNAPFYTRPDNDWSINAGLKAAAGAQAFFDPMQELCRGHDCLVYDHGHLVMRDYGHLAVFGRSLVYAGLGPFLHRASGNSITPVQPLSTDASRSRAASNE